jgi:hypothetical protein
MRLTEQHLAQRTKHPLRHDPSELGFFDLPSSREHCAWRRKRKILTDLYTLPSGHHLITPATCAHLDHEQLVVGWMRRFGQHTSSAHPVAGRTGLNSIDRDSRKRESFCEF